MLLVARCNEKAKKGRLVRGLGWLVCWLLGWIGLFVCWLIGLFAGWLVCWFQSLRSKEKTSKQFLKKVWRGMLHVIKTVEDHWELPSWYSNIAMENPTFTGKYHESGGFSVTMLVYQFGI